MSPLTATRAVSSTRSVCRLSGAGSTRSPYDLRQPVRYRSSRHDRLTEAQPAANVRSPRHHRPVGQWQPGEDVLDDPVPVAPLVLAGSEVDGHRVPQGAAAVAEAHVLGVQVVPGPTGEVERRRRTPVEESEQV